MRRFLPPLIAVLAALAVGLPQEPGDDPEANRQLLRELRGTDRYDRLVRNFERFRALPPEQQERLRRLDRELRQEEPESRDRLTHVLGEYAAWLGRLPEEDRRRVAAAADGAERLKLVREIRERQWVEAQPPARLAEWRAAPEAERGRLVERWRQEERARREEWAAARPWDARRWEAVARERPVIALLGDEKFRESLKEFVDNLLVPMLSKEERARLRPREGELRRNPAGWLAVVAELSERHPALAPQVQHARRADLPEEYRKVLDNPPARLPFAPAQVRNLPPEGKWPDYPIAVTKLVRAWKVPLNQQLGPSGAAELGPEVERFVAALPPADRRRLKGVEGKWPEYPQTLHEIARERKLALPRLGLPGAPDFWERVKTTAQRPRAPQRPK